MPVSPRTHALLAGCFAAMVLELAQVLAPGAELHQRKVPLPLNPDIEAVYRGLPDYTEGFVPMRFADLILLKTELVRRTAVTIGSQLWNGLHGTLERLLKPLNPTLSKEDIEHFERVLVAHGLAKSDQHGQCVVRQANHVWSILISLDGNLANDFKTSMRLSFPNPCARTANYSGSTGSWLSWFSARRRSTWPPDSCVIRDIWSRSRTQSWCVFVLRDVATGSFAAAAPPSTATVQGMGRIDSAAISPSKDPLRPSLEGSLPPMAEQSL
jgi:hypothetical protein